MVDELLDEINKRLTLNVLIQGCAAHTFLTAHHLVSEDLAAIDATLPGLYDRITIAATLQYWAWSSTLMFGRPERYWMRARAADHPLAQHPLLSAYGARLAAATRQHAVRQARKKGVSTLPIVFDVQLAVLYIKTLMAERDHRSQLANLAKRAACEVWGIEEARLDAQLTDDVEFGNLRDPSSIRGRLLRIGMKYGGYGGVARDGADLRVVAKARTWPFLFHELAKGTAELICLHGLNTLDHQTYHDVLEATDIVENEWWQLQVGPELWRQLLKVRPTHLSIAELLMAISREPPTVVQDLMIAMLEEPAAVRTLLQEM